MDNNSSYRQKLEKERDELQYLLSSGVQQGRGQMVARMRCVLTELDELETGEHWTQVQGDTQARIVLGELRSSLRKVISQ